jgi:hypothetical protein
MIDRQVRNQFVELLRDVLAGSMQISNAECSVCECAAMSRDAGIHAVYAIMEDVCESMAYSPQRPLFSSKTSELPPDIRRQLHMAMVFLASDNEYEWPALTRHGSRGDSMLLLLCGVSVAGGLLSLAISFVALPMAILACACFGSAVLLYRYSQTYQARKIAEWEQQLNKIGDYDVWPFLRHSDAETAQHLSGVSIEIPT